MLFSVNSCGNRQLLCCDNLLNVLVRYRSLDYGIRLLSNTASVCSRLLLDFGDRLLPSGRYRLLLMSVVLFLQSCSSCLQLCLWDCRSRLLSDQWPCRDLYRRHLRVLSIFWGGGRRWLGWDTFIWCWACFVRVPAVPCIVFWFCRLWFFVRFLGWFVRWRDGHLRNHRVTPPLISIFYYRSELYHK